MRRLSVGLFHSAWVALFPTSCSNLAWAASTLPGCHCCWALLHQLGYLSNATNRTRSFALLPRYPAHAGHLPDTEDAADVLVRASDGAHWVLSGPRVLPALNTHGTGCTLAAGVAAGLARGLSPEAAAAAAKAFVASAIRSSSGLPLGDGVQRPMDHGVRLLRVAAAAAPPSAAGAAGASAGQPPPQKQRPQPAPRAKGIFNPALYVITTSRVGAPAAAAAGGGGAPAPTPSWTDVLRAVEAAVEGGATCVQLREKHIDGKDFVELTKAAVAFCRPRGVAVIVNDRLVRTLTA